MTFNLVARPRKIKAPGRVRADIAILAERRRRGAPRSVESSQTDAVSATASANSGAPTDGSAQHDDLGADAGPLVEIGHVLVCHSDAAGGDRLADRVRLVGAMDAIERAGQVHRAGAERGVDASGHMARQIGTAPHHLRRRGPVRPLPLVGDPGHPRPGEAGAAYANSVFERLMAGQYEIEPTLAGVD